MTYDAPSYANDPALIGAIDSRSGYYYVIAGPPLARVVVGAYRNHRQAFRRTEAFPVVTSFPLVYFYRGQVAFHVAE